MAHKWFDHMNWRLTVLPRIGGICRADTWYNTKLSKVICFFATPVFPRFCCTVFVWILEFNPVFPFIVCFPPQCTAIDSSKSDLDLALFFGGEMKCTRKCQRYIYLFESNIDGSLALVVFFSLSGLNKTVSMKDKRFTTLRKINIPCKKALPTQLKKECISCCMGTPTQLSPSQVIY